MPKISIDSADFNYKLLFSNRAKHIRIQISSGGGIEVIIPQGGSVIWAERFLLNKKEWILKHVRKINQKENIYKFLGKRIYIEQQFDLFIKKFKIELIGNKLMLSIPEGNEFSEKKAFESWLRIKALEYIPERVLMLSKKYDFSFNRVTIRGQKSRWGSCSKNKNLSFNFKLMSFEKEVIDYIIIHELCHLKEMNHSKSFWSLVESYIPDFKKYKMLLKGVS